MLLGALIKQGLKISQSRLVSGRRMSTPAQLQRRELKKLLKKAKGTTFGIHYHFEEILKSKIFARVFREQIPVFNYNSIFDQWWHRCLEGEHNVCWPGHVKYFALSSNSACNGVPTEIHSAPPWASPYRRA